MKQASLRTRLILVASAFVTLIWFFAIVIVAVNLKWFLDRLIDLELERDMRLASHLYEIIQPNVDGPSLEAIQHLYQDVGMITTLQGTWGFKTFFSDGRVILGSEHVPDFPLPASAGFSDIEVDGETWRLYTREIEADIWTVLVANKSGATTLILRNLSSVPWFLLLILPLTILAAIYGIRRATRPVIELERTVRERSPRSLDPLDASQVPVEIEPLVNAVNQLLERVRKLVQHEHRFVANAAHELQTPLAAMKTELQNCMAQTDDAEVVRTLARLEARVNRSVYSVKQLLTLARLDPDTPLALNDSVDLERVVYDELAARGDDLLRLGLDCEVDCADAQLAGCNGELVKILVRNLVENALKYSTEGSDVDIGVLRRGDTLRLRVANDCAPLRPEALQQLRESFFRVPGNGSTGVGLGLAIVDRIAALHGGSVDFQYRRDNQGLAVTVSFPTAA